MINLNNQGVVVEGLGMGACPYSLSSVESATVTYIKDSMPVITEISPQSVCGSIAQYESWVGSLISYVESHTTTEGTFWGGVMLDEENDFGFTVSQLTTLNNSVQTQMGSTPGLSWWYSEFFSGQGNWSQASYNGLVLRSWKAPQVYTAYMVGLANGCGCPPTLVTWYAGNAAPFNSRTYADGQINGAPYERDFLGCSCTVPWDNQFTVA